LDDSDEKESISSVFHTLAGTDFDALVRSFRASSVLAYSRWIDPLVRRAIPERSLQGFRERVFLEDLPASASSVAVLCLDSTWNLGEACRRLAALPECTKRLLVFPRVTTLCRAAVERHGLAKLEIRELSLEIVPLEAWAFLVPCPRCFVESDITGVSTVARAVPARGRARRARARARSGASRARCAAC
jgi:hypothetical protein